MQTPEEEPNVPIREWRVRLASGKEFGPASSDELRDWVSQRRVPANALLLRDGWSTWQQAQQVFPELSNASPEIERAPSHSSQSRGWSHDGGLIECLHCGKSIANNALACPHCGGVEPTWTFLGCTLPVWIVCLVVAFFVVVASCLPL